MKDDIFLLSKDQYDKLFELVGPKINNFIEKYKMQNGSALLKNNWKQSVMSKKEELELREEALCLLKAK